MKSIVLKLAVAAGIFCVAQSAFALRPYAAAVWYFDSTGVLIGATIVDCQNIGWHEGAQKFSYYIYAYSGCISPYKSTLYPGTGVANYVLPGGETIQQGCTTPSVQCLGGTIQPSPENSPPLTWSSGWVDPTISF
ncbi:hypothetical protein [Dyella acidiphila]|uniref:Secreted protein n=1 Tax=Dyella acidiphila TaxID=2775866 RepID=A0ABR9GA50_9GAMM|nr:hypothetical protein [Dyella acidiphila]MBE1160917.1 hypothetical protein [Dyella acidiphila]